jgi:uncharacterized protein YciI
MVKGDEYLQERRLLFIDLRLKTPNKKAKKLSDDEAADLREEHLAYCARLKKQGKLWGAGPFRDGTGGMIIYSVDSIEEAMALANKDPSILRGTQKPVIKPWSVGIYSTKWPLTGKG